MYTIEQIRNQIFCGDALTVLKDFPDKSISCVMTSPPYYALRDYGEDGQIGGEPNWQLYIQHLYEIFGEVKRVLRDDGTVFVNIGDSYNDKSLMQIPERFSLMMTDKLGYIKRNTIIWYKPNCMPSSVDDRFTVDFEPVYFFTKGQNYYFEQQLEDISEAYANDKRPHGVLRQRLYNNSKYVQAGMVSKYSNDVTMESLYRQGINKNRGSNVIEKRNLPQQKEFVDVMRKSFTVDEIVKTTDISRSTVEHWFRYDESGFSFPSREDWLKLGTNLFPELLEVFEDVDEVRSARPNKRNKRCVWAICPRPSPDKHFAMYPEELCVTPIFAGCPEYICKKCGKTKRKIFKDEDFIYTDCGCGQEFDKGIVLDMFAGSGTTLRVARKLHRDYVGIELNPEYVKIIEKNLAQQYLDF